MDSWPTGLQQVFDESTFQLDYGDPTVRTDMDVGPAKVRARLVNAVDVYTCSITMSLDESSTLRDFYRTTLAGGSLPFLFLDPMTNANGIFRFAQPPSIKPLGGLVFQVGMKWEKLANA